VNAAIALRVAFEVDEGKREWFVRHLEVGILRNLGSAPNPELEKVVDE
jgi:hypothetical protein